MADGSNRQANEICPTQLVTVGCEPDFYRETWRRSKLPIATRFRMENIDRRVNAVNALSEMLGAHIRGKDDAADNEGVRYSWLTDRQAWAIADAVSSLLTTVCEDLELIREDSIDDPAS